MLPVVVTVMVVVGGGAKGVAARRVGGQAPQGQTEDESETDATYRLAS